MHVVVSLRRSVDFDNGRVALVYRSCSSQYSLVNAYEIRINSLRAHTRTLPQYDVAVNITGERARSCACVNAVDCDRSIRSYGVFAALGYMPNYDEWHRIIHMHTHTHSHTLSSTALPPYV